MLITRHDRLANDAARRRAFGVDHNVVEDRPRPGEYDVVDLDHNHRMTEPAAAMGLAQMQRLEAFLAARAANFQALAGALAGIDGLRVLPDGAAGSCTRFTRSCGRAEETVRPAR